EALFVAKSDWLPDSSSAVDPADSGACLRRWRGRGSSCPFGRRRTPPPPCKLRYSSGVGRGSTGIRLRHPSTLCLWRGRRRAPTDVRADRCVRLLLFVPVPCFCLRLRSKAPRRNTASDRGGRRCCRAPAVQPPRTPASLCARERNCDFALPLRRKRVPTSGCIRHSAGRASRRVRCDRRLDHIHAARSDSAPARSEAALHWEISQWLRSTYSAQPCSYRNQTALVQSEWVVLPGKLQRVMRQ